MDGPRRTRFAALVAVLLALSAATGAVGATTSSNAFGVQSVDPDQVLLRVDVQPDGDAEWRVEYRVRLDTENETQAFEDLQADLAENDSAYISSFAERIRGTVTTAENATGREMAAEGFSVDARVTQLPQEYGVLTYTFTWTNFAVIDGDRLIVGDALAGFFLDSETTLAIGWPSDHRTASVSPEPSERQTDAVLWRGPLDFADGEPRVVVEPEPAGTTTDDGGGEPTTPGGEDEGTGLGAIAALVVGVLVVGAAGFLYLRRGDRDDGSTPGGGAGPGDDGRGGDGDPDAVAAAADGTDAGMGSASTDLLSNEERVVHFLEERGGRAKQQEIVDGLGWTDAKTSQVISGMASEEQVEKFRIGRENVVKLPDDDPTDGVEL